MKNFRKRSLKAFSAVVVLILVLTMGLSVCAAATGTTSDSVNVRSIASTSGSIVGTTTPGTTVEVTAEETDSSNQTWYAVTLSDGTTGYIRGDLISVSGTIGEEETAAEDTSEADAAAADAFAAAASTAETENTATTTPTSDEYQLVYTADENGNNTWYLYFLQEDSRMKISDIQDMAAALEAAQSTKKTSSGPFKILMIVFIILFIIAAALCVFLFLKVREMTSDEVDLARTRDRERRVNKNADAVTIRRGEGNRSRERSGAYASGEKSADRVRTARGAGSAAGSAERTPVRRSADGTPVRRSADAGATAARRSAVSAESRERTVRPDGTVRRSSADGSVRTRSSMDYSASEQRESGVRRTPAGSRDGASRPVTRQDTGSQPVRRTTQAKNFADDDDMDYGFIGGKRE